MEGQGFREAGSKKHYSRVKSRPAKPFGSPRPPPKVKAARRRSNRAIMADNGHAESMVRIGWGVEKMLEKINEKRRESGLQALDQILDTRILALIEARKQVQRKNTRQYQARKTAAANMGDIESAKKLKWSEQRITALKLWVSNGKIGRFDAEEAEYESDSNESLEEGIEKSYGSDEPQSDFADYEPSPEMGDNINVASHPVGTWTGQMISRKPTMTALPKEREQESDVFVRYQGVEDGSQRTEGPHDLVSPGDPVYDHSDVGHHALNSDTHQSSHATGYADFMDQVDYATQNFHANFDDATYYTKPDEAELPGEYSIPSSYSGFPDRYPSAIRPAGHHHNYEEIEVAQRDVEAKMDALKVAQDNLNKVSGKFANVYQPPLATVPRHGALRSIWHAR